MDKVEFKTAWLEALRSGDYAQHQGGWCGQPAKRAGLRPPSFCCLAVAADVVRGNENTPNGPIIYGSNYTSIVSPYFATAGNLWTNLVHMNDGRGHYKGKPQTFEQIADYIEANYNP